MRRSLLFAAVWLVGVGRSDCASPSPLQSLVANFTQLHDLNISYDAEITSELTPFALADLARQNIKAEPKWKSKISFSANGRKFDLEVTRFGINQNTSTFSYDGSTYQSIHGLFNDLTISKTDEKSPPEVFNTNSLLLAAGMFKPNAFQQIDCLWRDVTAGDYWSDLLGTIKLDGGKVGGVIKGTKISVGFDINSPMGIATITTYQGTSDVPSMKYTIGETGELPFQMNGLRRIFYFPKKAVIQFYEPVTGELLKTDTHEITAISINNPEFDEAKFTVDPSSVDKIYDYDSKVWIRIPK